MGTADACSADGRATAGEGAKGWMAERVSNVALVASASAASRRRAGAVLLVCAWPPTESQGAAAGETVRRSAEHKHDRRPEVRFHAASAPPDTIGRARVACLAARFPSSPPSRRACGGTEPDGQPITEPTSPCQTRRDRPETLVPGRESRKRIGRADGPLDPLPDSSQVETCSRRGQNCRLTYSQSSALLPSFRAFQTRPQAVGCSWLPAACLPA